MPASNSYSFPVSLTSRSSELSSHLNVLCYTSRNGEVLKFVFTCQVDTRHHWLEFTLTRVSKCLGVPPLAGIGVRYGVKTEARELRCRQRCDGESKEEDFVWFFHSLEIIFRLLVAPAGLYAHTQEPACHLEYPALGRCLATWGPRSVAGACWKSRQDGMVGGPVRWAEEGVGL